MAMAVVVDVSGSVLHHHDRVVHDDSDGEDEPEQRGQVDREAERGHHGEGADQRDGNGGGGNQ